MTIQGKLERVLSVMANTQVEVIGAGRTDAGVHAKGMVANAHLDTELDPDGIRDYMNCYLPDDICVREVREASDRFHSRYNALGKTYCYTCYVGPIMMGLCYGLGPGCGADAAGSGISHGHP